MAQSNASPSPTPKVEASPSPTPNSPIRSVDFANFTFPAKPIDADGEKYFTLKNSEYVGRLQDGAIEPYPVSLVQSVYGDVTDDGNEEAMLVLTGEVAYQTRARPSLRDFGLSILPCRQKGLFKRRCAMKAATPSR
ncbi:MAG TPA: hypothetical protein VNA19_10810 [Pyrinomonadaceae bacterium]|nr:hypothetical protein [Pyrinomonadaceae bacterium]